MDIGTISSRYARALFDSAEEKGLEGPIYEKMKMLATCLLIERKLIEALRNPILPREEKERLLQTAGGDGECGLYTNFIRMVLRHKRESLLPFISYIYIHLYRKKNKIVKVQFSSVEPIGPDTEAHLKEKLQKETGCTIEFSGKTDPDLLGGFRLRIGNYRVDASFATQLREIRSRLLEKH